MDSIPLYVTGRYKLPQVNDWRPYLKLNLGYAVNNIGGRSFQSSNSRYKSINDSVIHKMALIMEWVEDRV